MVVSLVSHGGLKFNILKNRIGVAKDCILKRHVPAVETRPLANATVVKAPPAKKAKVKG